jgi:hypothetical protein
MNTCIRTAHVANVADVLSLQKGSGKKAHNAVTELGWEFFTAAVREYDTVAKYERNGLTLSITMINEGYRFSHSELNGGSANEFAYRLTDMINSLAGRVSEEKAKVRQLEAESLHLAQTANAAVAKAAYEASDEYENDKWVRQSVKKWTEVPTTFVFDTEKHSLKWITGEAEKFARDIIKRDLALAVLEREGNVKEYDGEVVVSVHSLKSAAELVCRLALQGWDATSRDTAHMYVKAVNDMRFNFGL